MSVVKMSRLRLLGLKTEQNRIMNVLIRSGLFEVTPTSDVGAGGKKRGVNRIDRLAARQAKVSLALNFLKSLSAETVAILENNLRERKRDPSVQPVEFDYTPLKRPKSRQMIGYDDFYDVAAKEYELITVCEALEKLSFEKLEIKSKLSKLENMNRNLAPYEYSPLPFSQIGETRHTFVAIAVGPVTTRPSVLSGFTVFTETYPSKKGVLLCMVGRKADQEKITAALMGDGFTMCPYRYEKTAAELIRGFQAEAETLAARALAVSKDALTYERYISELQILYDVLGQGLEKAKAECEFACTRDTFVIEGWIPDERAEDIVSEVRAKTPNVVAYVTEAKESDSPPTLLKNAKVFQPYEDVTNMFSVPSYGESDPNPFMAVFFFVFFGIMLGDAGYGIVLSIVCGLAVRFLRPEKGMRRLMLLVCMGGISAVVWGLLFGGIFSIPNIPPLWFNPLDEPLMMLGLSLALGAVQLLFAYGLHSARLFREHRPMDAILDSLFIYVLFAGIACLAMALLLAPQTNTLLYTGLGLLFGALVGIALTNGRHGKGIFKKILGGFSGLYGIVNLASDLLSYARIFGLGLASGAIGMAFNTLAIMLFDIPVIGYVIGGILLIPLHAFNIGIGVLGAYVHNARLQFLEFYGKFYDGGGRLFAPMGAKTRYVRFA